MTAKLKMIWRNRFDALVPSAVIAFDAAAKKLKEKLLALDDEKLGFLQGVFSENLLFITGVEENLPWTNSVIYLGKDALATQIFFADNRRPDMPLDLFKSGDLNEALKHAIPLENMQAIKELSEQMPFLGFLRPRNDMQINYGRQTASSSSVVLSIIRHKNLSFRIQARKLSDSQFATAIIV